ncbi:hypothetical protein AZ004_005005, partial [Escherichia coli]
MQIPTGRRCRVGIGPPCQALLP